ncbi:MAG TPA: hypothetical protein VM677_29265 [Actinokineospora sp.]|nr:hypothetical protein [Actinokineospora sp.]
MVSELHSARGLLRQAVADLVSPTSHTQHVRGTPIVHSGPSLLDQLRDAVGSSGGLASGGKSGGAHSPMPVDAGALDLLGEIDEYAARELWRSEPATCWVGTTLARRSPAPAIPTEDRIRLAADYVARVGTEAWHLDWLTALLRDWADEVRTMLDPAARERPLWAPCPSCGNRWATRVDSSGETVKSPALVIRRGGATECRACGADYAGVDMREINRRIDDAEMAADDQEEDAVGDTPPPA